MKIKTILGIETSCDETAAAVVQDGTKIISNVVASSQSMHARYGGIIPDQAAREQVKSIIPILKEALISPVDAIAVTIGPGLIGSLLVGVETAKTLALTWNKPITPVNHLIGHIYANFLEPRTQNLKPPSFPALVLLVSGGHTELILMKGHGQFKLLGSTLDDAAGECFDKCGRLLGLPYPYGPFIETLAQKHTGKAKVSLPRPLIHQRNWDFSFSGLKTAFLYAFQSAQKTDSLTDDFKAALAFELEEAITDVLATKFKKASQELQTKSVIVCGGVAANQKLRQKMEKAFEKVYIPPLNLCTDNAAYIASTAFFNYKPVPWEKITADPSLDF